MRRALQALAALALVHVVAACQLLPSSVTDGAARAVRHYCAEPAELRASLHESINAVIVPNSIAVTCADDAIAPAPDEPPPEG